MVSPPEVDDGVHVRFHRLRTVHGEGGRVEVDEDGAEDEARDDEEDEEEPFVHG